MVAFIGQLANFALLFLLTVVLIFQEGILRLVALLRALLRKKWPRFTSPTTHPNAFDG